MEEQPIRLVVLNTQKNPDFDRPKDSCFLVRWLQLHTLIQLGRSLIRPLSKRDMFNLTPDIHPETNLLSLKEAQEADPNRKNDLVQMLFYRVLMPEFVWTGFLAIVASGLAFAGPFVIQKILEFLNNPSATTVQQNIAYSYAGLWIGLYLVRIFVNQYCQRMITYMSTKAEQVLTIQLLSKMCRLAPSYKFQDHKDRGFLLGYLTTEVAGVTGFFNSSTVLFSAPATLIAVQVLLFMKVGLIAFVLVVLLVIAAIIQVILYFKILKTTGKKLAIMGQRGLNNLQFFYGIEDIKLFGWQQIIIEKNMKLRDIENKYNKLQQTYINIFELVINLVPVFSVFLIFIILYAIDGRKQLDTTLVYTILSLVGLSYEPTKSLLMSITAAIAGMASLRKISEFMEAPQVSNNPIRDNGTEVGLLVINNLLASWQTQQNGKVQQVNLTRNQNNTVQSIVHQKEDIQLEQINPPIPLSHIDVKTGKLKYFSIPREVRIKKGDRVILFSKPQAGKSTFFQTLIGNLNIISGVAKYGGTVGYLPQTLWFRKTTVRDNILFGQQYDRKKLDFVFKMVGLKQELGFFRNGQRTIMDQNNGMSEGQRRRIALARVLYANPDLLLLDEVFASLDIETARYIYGNLCQYYADKTIIISTHITAFIRPQDKILLLKEGTVIQFGTTEELASNKEMQQPVTSRYNEESLYKGQALLNSQIVQKQERMCQLKNKLRMFVRNLLALTKGLDKNQIQEKVFLQAEKRQKQRKEEAKNAKRIPGVPLNIYKMHFDSAPIGYYVILFLLCILTQGVKVFSGWWIGSVNSLPWAINANIVLVIYIVLVLAYGILQLTTGLVGPKISVITARTINEQLCRSLSYTNFKWHVDNNCAKVADKVNKDNSEFFLLTSNIEGIFRSSLTFLATVILVGISTPLFFVLAAGVILIDVLILLLYMRATRQLHVFKDEYKDALFLTFEETINGIDLLRAFGKTSNPRSAAIRQVYNKTVFKINLKFVDQGMSIITEIVSLGIIAGAAFFAVASKLDDSKTQDDVAIIGSSISFAMQVTGIVGGIIWNVAGIEGLLDDNVTMASEIIGKNQQKNYFLDKPEGWPKNSEIDFDHVTLRYPGFLDPSIKDIKLKIKSGERIYIAGRSGSGKGSILKAVTKYLEPVKNIDRTMGVLRIAGVDIQTIGRKYICDNIVALNPVPFIFTASLRQNLDPFGVHPDIEIKDCLEKVGVWQILSRAEIEQGIDIVDQTKAILDQKIYDGGSHFSLGLIQQFNITRALLIKPKIIVWDTAGSSLSHSIENRQFDAIKESLKNCTVLVISSKVTTAMACDRAIYMSEGRIKEYGKPHKMAKNKSSAFGKLMHMDQASLELIKILDSEEQENSE